MERSLLGKVRGFDKDRLIKVGIDVAMNSLKDFRVKYPFVENPESIETLNPDEVFKRESDEVGEFFHWIEYYLKPVGHLTLYSSNPYRQIRNQFEDFQELLYTAVDSKKTLAQKVDAPWEKIKGLGGDKHIAKKIIFCFNYENGGILPIFNINHLQHFVNEIVNKPSFPAQCDTPGEMYEFLISELLRVKEDLLETQSWEPLYFARFLYQNYPPPKMETPIETMKGLAGKNEPTREQVQFREFVSLLNALQMKGKISGEQYREYRRFWTERPQDRESLHEQLKILLNK
jgi:hypothetical protein